MLNVRYLDETLVRTLLAAKRRSEPVSIAYLDVNELKTINDTQGHQRGDEILRTVGTAINNISRAEDRCFRYGGDEFCLILPNCKEEMAREMFMNRLGDAIRRAGEDVTFSVGIVEASPDENNRPYDLIREADRRMFVAKRQHKIAAGIDGSEEIRRA